MKKIFCFLCVVLLIAGAFWLGTVISDKQVLRENVIRLHVVADSDSIEDQTAKLLVRDALLKRLDGVVDSLTDMDSAKIWIEEHLSELEQIANDTLKENGNSCKAEVSLSEEEFPTREYDTFVLPAGVYESLCVTIGSGEGKNWWCVVFPNLCISASTEGFEDTAVSAGFSDRLTGALSGKQEYRVRFFLMDCFGRLENWFFSS